MNTNSSIDVLGLGAVAVDDLVYVEAYPPADVKSTILRSERQCGGLTGTALVAAARLGAHAAYAGVLGTDEFSSFAIQGLEHEGINLTHLRRRNEGRVVHSYIIVDVTAHTRNVFSDSAGVIGPVLDWPPQEVIGSARVLFVDHFGLPGMIRAARIARAKGIPVVADFERVSGPEFNTLLELVDHLVVGQRLAKQLTGQEDPGACVKALSNSSRKAVVVTCGADGAWYAESGEKEVRRQAAFAVQAVDTTGCGDVFHGAYAAGLAWGWPVRECIRFASAAAALKATKQGGQSGIPMRKEVERFLSR